MEIRQMPIINPYEDLWTEIDLSQSAFDAYSLNEWSERFSMMTAGYRDQLDPGDAANPDVPFNSLTIAIMAEAKARVFKRKLAEGTVSHVHIGGETRPHTQEFIAILSRVYAAHDIRVHLRAGVKTTPIWYSSFGVFYQEYQSGDNLTASHSPYFKGGWKPMDSDGKQLLEDAKIVEEEVRSIVRNRDQIRLAPWLSSGNILHDFDVDDAYASYLRSVVGDSMIAEISRAAGNGFKCAACTVGGSMRATSERIFSRLGIPTGTTGVVQYFMAEEDSKYHSVGFIDGIHHGADPGKPQIYRHIGAQDLLCEGKTDVVFIWDPDGDRFNMVTRAPAPLGEVAAEFGLEIEPFPGEDSCIVYFTPNQIYLMLAVYRLAALKQEGLLRKYDWFITRSVATTRALDEIAAKANIPAAEVRVGFKYMGALSEWAESRANLSDKFGTPTGSQIMLGANPRVLLMCEESGGAVFGGIQPLNNRSGSRSLLALREKDGMQIAIMALSLACHLFHNGKSFAEYYCDLITENNIQHKHYRRRDVLLYDESLTGEKRDNAMREGLLKRDRIMAFFFSLINRTKSGETLPAICHEINSHLPKNTGKLAGLKELCDVGDGVYMNFDDLWCLIRPSGTDAVVRYYVEGESRAKIDQALDALVNAQV
jgi:phosphomannomutase